MVMKLLKRNKIRTVRVKWKKERVELVVSLYLNGMDIKSISKAFGFYENEVRDAIYSATHGLIEVSDKLRLELESMFIKEKPKRYSHSKKRGRKKKLVNYSFWTEEFIRNAIDLRLNNRFTFAQIANKLHVNVSTVSNLFNRIYHKEYPKIVSEELRLKLTNLGKLGCFDQKLESKLKIKAKHKSTKRWSDKLIERIINLYCEGLSYKQITNKLHLGKYQCKNIIYAVSTKRRIVKPELFNKLKAITPKFIWKRNNWTETQIRKAIEMRLKRKTYAQIENVIHKPCHIISYFFSKVKRGECAEFVTPEQLKQLRDIKKLGIHDKQLKSKHNVFPEQVERINIEKMCLNYLTGMTHTELAEKYDMSVLYIKEFIRKLCMENYTIKIDTEILDMLKQYEGLDASEKLLYKKVCGFFNKCIVLYEQRLTEKD